MFIYGLTFSHSVNKLGESQNSLYLCSTELLFSLFSVSPQLKKLPDTSYFLLFLADWMLAVASVTTFSSSNTCIQLSEMMHILLLRLSLLIMQPHFCHLPTQKAGHRTLDAQPPQNFKICASVKLSVDFSLHHINSSVRLRRTRVRYWDLWATTNSSKLV